MDKDLKYYRAAITEGEDPRVKDFKEFLKNLTNEKVEEKITDEQYKNYIKKYTDILAKYKTK